jgi:hypothetical protein
LLKIKPGPKGPSVITYRASLDIAQPIGRYLARLLAEERAARGTRRGRRGRRALSVWGQAVLVLRWFRDATPLARLAVDARISIATAYRCLHEGPLSAAAARGLVTLADKAYQVAGIGILTPIKGLPGNHPLRGHPLNPSRRGAITQAALVLTQQEHQGRC